MSMDTNTLLLSLIRAALDGGASGAECKPQLTQDALKQLYMHAKTYDLAHFVGYALEKLGMANDNAVTQEYVRLYMFAVCRYERIRYDVAQVYHALEEKGISYLPLKGTVLRELYDAPWMRTSCDIDILIQEENLDVARATLVDELGFTFDQNSDHDVSFYTPSGTHFELHFSLIEDDVVGNVDAPLAHAWERAHAVGDTPYHLAFDNETFYYYHMAHMAKHFVQGGCGIRPFLDVWVMQARLAVDHAVCDQMLEQGGILTFARAAEQLAAVWFGGASHTPLTEQMQAFLLEGGEFGTYATRAAVAQVRKGGKVRYALSRIWLSYRQMCVFYPSLKEKKWLLPLYEVWRWLRLLFGGGVRRSAQELYANQTVSEQQREQTAHMLRSLGL